VASRRSNPQQKPLAEARRTSPQACMTASAISSRDMCWLSATGASCPHTLLLHQAAPRTGTREAAHRRRARWAAAPRCAARRSRCPPPWPGWAGTACASPAAASAAAARSGAYRVRVGRPHNNFLALRSGQACRSSHNTASCSRRAGTFTQAQARACLSVRPALSPSCPAHTAKQALPQVMPDPHFLRWCRQVNSI